MAFVHGPIEMAVGNESGKKCSQCGRTMKLGEAMFVGRFGGEHIRACSEKHFDDFVNAIAASTGLPVVKCA